ncbi:MAG: UvrD-helicase domain-containing protein (plasmid) [Candidatus Methanoperedens sp.]|nr:MAG: UvrD-helicase domain-containing protein [Candidatus Methanoperedens sp.]
MLDSLLLNLKPRQLYLIKHTQAPQLILAGAGTGKTTTITAKIAYMVEKENIDPSRILALTFSKEAARNMREKVEKFFREIFVDNAITNLFAGIRRRELIDQIQNND